MAIQKSWDFAKVRDKAKTCILSIYAENIGKDAALDATFGYNYEFKKLAYQWNNNSYGGKSTYTYRLMNNTAIDDSLLKNVPVSKVEEQFLAFLKTRKLTEDNFKGKMISARTVQAIVESMIQFILARYQVWINPESTKYAILYNQGSVAYGAMNYNFDIVDFNDNLTKDGFDTIMISAFNSALASIVTRRQAFGNTYTSCSCSSSCSSSSCSSSCSSSSSSSCSSSSCSSSCSSSAFIAYMNLSRQF